MRVVSAPYPKSSCCFQAIYDVLVRLHDMHGTGEFVRLDDINLVDIAGVSSIDERSSVECQKIRVTPR